MADADRLSRLKWVVQRASRMSLPEILHRVREQVRRRSDARRPGAWDRFGHYSSRIEPIPGLTVDWPDLGVRAAIADAAEDVLADRIRLLNQSWPSHAHDEELWRLDPVTGELWPGRGHSAFRIGYRHRADRGDVKFVWELNRLQFLQPLACQNGPESAEAVANWLASWMAANPPYDGINWTNGIEAASRLVSILVATTAIGEPLITLAGPKLLAFVEAHVEYLHRYPSLYSSSNNHRVAELSALYVTASLVTGLPGSEALRRRSQAELESEVLRQFHADGIGAEQSPTYAAYSLEWFALAGVVAERQGAPFGDHAKARLKVAAEAICWFLSDDGVAPELGDNDAGRVLSLGRDPEPRYCASVAALVGRWLRVPMLRNIKSDPNVRDLLCPVVDDEQPTHHQLGFRVFPDGGWTLVRQPVGTSTLCLTFDHAPLGFLSIAAHGHADALAVTLTIGDDPILIDPGTYLYHAGRGVRDRFRGTAVHNTLSLDGQDQSMIAGAFNWRRHAQTRLVAHGPDWTEAKHDGYVGRFGLSHRRRVTVQGPGRFLIEDNLDGTPKSTGLTWAVGQAVHPDVSIDLAGPRVRLTTRSGWVVDLAAEQPATAWSVDTIPYSPSFNVLGEARRLALSGAISTAPVSVRTRIDLVQDASQA